MTGRCAYWKGKSRACAPLLDSGAARWRADAVADAANNNNIGHLRLFDAFAPMYRAHLGGAHRKGTATVDCTHWVYSAPLFQPLFSRLHAHLAHRFGDVVGEVVRNESTNECRM